MVARRLLPGMVSLALCGLACARVTDQKMQQAWNDATTRSAEPSETPQPAQSPDNERWRGRIPDSEGWEKLIAMMERSIRILSRSPDSDRFGAVGRRWCEVEPESQDTEYGAVQVCAPKGGLELDGHDCILEVGSSGVIAWVVQDADDLASLALLATAREKTASQCATPFRPVAKRSGMAEGPQARHEQFETCPVEGGSTLAVGRIPNPGRETWQISIAVVGAN